MQSIASEIFWFIIAILLGITAIVLVIILFFAVKISIKFLIHVGKNYHLMKTKPIFIKTKHAIKQRILSVEKIVHYYTGIRLIK